MAASDEVAVHAGYAGDACACSGWRPALSSSPAESAGADGKVRLGSGASAALHAKAFAVDRRRIFVGSFNFDQRSALLNTEMGLVIDSPSLARKLAAFFDVDAPAVAYEVRLAPGGHDLEWIERTPTGEVRHLVEPGTRWYLRTGVEMLSLLPIEWLL
jgi:putative cardiolipin synthase